MTPICPSATGDTPDAQIIGFIGTDGVVGSIAPPIPLTEEIREAVGPRPESKFRLSGQCVELKCGNWQNQACALIDRMRQQVDRLKPSLAAVGQAQTLRHSHRLRVVATDRTGSLPGLLVRDLQPVGVMPQIRRGGVMLIACPHCGERAQPGKYCSNCGAKVEKTCRSCSAINAPDARFCASCGTAFEPATRGLPAPELDASEAQQKQVTVLFADICGSTELIARMDAEDASVALGSVLGTIVKAMTRFGGV